MANLSSREVRARMPEELLFEIIELLRGSFGNATRTMVLEIYERKLRGLLLRMDGEADIQDIPLVAGQSIYAVREGTTRIMAVLLNETGLYKTGSAARDLLEPNWQTEANGTPEVWWNEKVDPGIDNEATITAEQFMIRPAPAIRHG